MKEYYYDKLLGIKTAGDQRGFHQSLHYHRYEPTPYAALEKLFNQYEVKPSDRVVDFGCGKGRLNFYVHYFHHASAAGIEMDGGFCQEAEKNKLSYGKRTKTSSDKLQFYCCLAEDYQIQPQDNRFYFFNPFSVQVFMKVVQNILRSVERAKREVELILYYPADDYIYFLEKQTLFELTQEIELPDLSKHDQFERFLIYRLAY
ncbi:methyltransferase [Peribacillus deserti]|uniref:SAM-dependent methyltransferase n=1 Tax=Peribacillus deserti TaxID=673318 RepID=A0A2N5M5R4_9BACI|nr:methyltransferase [Peribacillus deserti]PLT29672.1 SAM-dependent methyltransferase [Peribacillus deserti]